MAARGWRGASRAAMGRERWRASVPARRRALRTPRDRRGAPEQARQNCPTRILDVRRGASSGLIRDPEPRNAGVSLVDRPSIFGLAFDLRRVEARRLWFPWLRELRSVDVKVGTSVNAVRYRTR